MITKQKPMRLFPILRYAAALYAFAALPAGSLAADSHLFLDEFEDRTELGPGYKVARAKEGAFTVRDSILIGRQTEDDHGAVIRRELDFDDIEFQLDFRFNGGSRFNFVIDDKNEKSVHAGHICRVSLSPKRLMIGDDKLGAMNLEVRALRQQEELPSEEANALTGLLAATQATAPLALEKGKWYTLCITINGDLMSAAIDGEEIARLSSPSIAHPTKTKFGMTVNGATIDFDNLKVSAIPRITESRVSNAPNILWVITDDHRPDALACFNRATRGTDHSALGFVHSPEADKLAARGTLFTQAFCNSPGCAPSRASLVTGQYPFHNGIYGFEQAHDQAAPCKPTIPQVMRGAGYHTAEFGKHGYRINRWGPGLTWTVENQYEHRVDRKNDLEKNGQTDYRPNKPWVKGKVLGREEMFYYPDGSVKRVFVEREGGVSEEEVAAREAIDKELDILRAHTRESSLMIIGGQSSQPAEKTLDAEIASAFIDYLGDADRPEMPLFTHLGFHFPHTPVLPPKQIRELFMAKEKETPYRIPDYEAAETEKLPPQLQRLHQKMNFSNLKPAEKLQAIRDYYAFCAHGDAQVGRAVDAFIASSEKEKREWVVVYVVGDHSWHLGEQGIESKFGPWAMSNHNAIIALSSIDGLFPAGKVVHDFVEFVDIAPTFYKAAGIDLEGEDFSYLDGTSLAAPQKRDYILGEFNHVIGPRAYLRSKDFAFSMRTRETNGKPGAGFKPGTGIKWALECPRPAAELVLYDLRNDPGERWNVADDPKYAELADWFRAKLGSIVLGDGRVEIDWKQENAYHVSEFAKGTDDKKLAIPADLVPAP